MPKKVLLAPPENIMVQAENLVKIYKSRDVEVMALQGLDLTVERGELLLETVSGTLDGLYAPETKVVSDRKGVIASVDADNGTSVEKGAKIATIYPEDAIQVSMVISESDLMDVHVGDSASIEFNWDADGESRFEGVVSSISYVNEKKQEGGSSAAEYVACIDFTPDDTVRLGMTVVVYVQ